MADAPALARSDAAADAHAQHAPVAATDTIAVVESDAGTRRSYGSTGLRANA